MNLVAIPFHDWKKCEHEGFRTRDAHFMQEFGRHPKVDKLLVINRPISLAEQLLLKRPRYPRNGRLLWQKSSVYLSQVANKTYTLDIAVPQIVRPLWMKRNWIPWIFGQYATVQAVKQGLDYLGMSNDYNLFTVAPLFVPLVRQLTPTYWAFDALDNLLKHSFYRTTPYLAEYYDYCLEQADFLSANSLETTKWFHQIRPDTQWIPNGVDAEMFSTKQTHSRPEDMQHIAAPVVGYAGKMQEMLDRELVERALRELPEVNFVFIGQQLNPKWVQELWQYPNAHYLGDKPYRLLPQYLAAFDICIIPYNTERQHGGDPIKFYEYLAMGKPIVTTDIGGVRIFQDYPQVYISNTTEQFIERLRSVVSLISAGTPIETRPVPNEYMWQTKANHIIHSLIRS
jgi:teichuronic acid biosynthesis glycosyltransferase TuaH